MKTILEGQLNTNQNIENKDLVINEQLVEDTNLNDKPLSLETIQRTNEIPKYVTDIIKEYNPDKALEAAETIKVIAYFMSLAKKLGVEDHKIQAFISANLTSDEFRPIESTDQFTELNPGSIKTANDENYNAAIAA